MATVTKSTRRRQSYEPSPGEIEAATAEIHARRLAEFDATLDAREAAEERAKKLSRDRTREWRKAKRARAIAAAPPADEAEPIDLDEHRDPRQTERRRRSDIQCCWDARKERMARAADADSRGVLNYYSINRTPRGQMKGIEFEEAEMLPRDIANVELLEFSAVDDALGMLIDAVESQHEMEDLNCHWSIVDQTPRAPKAAEPAVIPFKTVLKPKRFRSSV